MRIEDLTFALSGLIELGKYWLDCELAFLLLPWEWEVFKRGEPGRLEACLGPFYIDVSWGIKRDLGELEERVFAVAERHDLDSEEIEQDIKDAVEAVRGYTPGEGISVLETLERMRKEGKL